MSSLQLLLLSLLSLTYDTINATNAMERYYYCYYYCWYHFITFLLIVKIIIIIIHHRHHRHHRYTTITNSIIVTRKGKHDYARRRTTNGDELFRFVFRRSNRDERKCQISCVNSLSEKWRFKEFVIALKKKKKSTSLQTLDARRRKERCRVFEKTRLRVVANTFPLHWTRKKNEKSKRHSRNE